MNRIIEIAAMTIGGLSLFVVAFVGFVSLSGTDMSQVAVIGRFFPAPADEESGAPGAGDAAAEPAEEPSRNLSDAAVIEASLGVLSAWTLPSPYSSSELRVLSEEIKTKHAQLAEREHALARRERAAAEDERELEERLRSLEELRAHLEGLQLELSEREVELGRKADAALAGDEARWAELAGVIGAIDDAADAAARLQEYAPADAAKILRALDDDERAGEILNAVPGERWKSFVDAYGAEKARAASRKRAPRS